MKKIIIAILLVVAVFAVAILFDVYIDAQIDAQKTKCLEVGGRWVTGMVGGEMSYFCMPK